MSRRRRTQIGGQFSARRKDMLESPAYRALSLSAHRVIDRIAVEHCNQGGAENGRLIVTYDDFERYGVHRHAIGPAIREAEALGFIEVVERGRAGNAEFRSPSRYRLTFHRAGRDIGDGTHEWRHVTEEQAKAIAKAARHAKPENSNSQWRKTPILGGEKRHRKCPILGADSTTTELSADSTTTIYISGRDAA